MGTLNLNELSDHSAAIAMMAAWLNANGERISYVEAFKTVEAFRKYNLHIIEVKES